MPRGFTVYPCDGVEVPCRYVEAAVRGGEYVWDDEAYGSVWLEHKDGRIWLCGYWCDPDSAPECIDITQQAKQCLDGDSRG